MSGRYDGTTDLVDTSHIQEMELLSYVCKKTDPSIEACTILAEPSLVLSWVELALKNSISIFTHISTPTCPLSEIRARHTTVMELFFAEEI
jgi:hypothetical protein